MEKTDSKFDLNQGIAGGKYSILKIFHHPKKITSFLEGEITAPPYVRIKPTNDCNQTCFFCVYNEPFSGIHPTMDRNDLIPREKMMETLDDLKSIGTRAITYSGGGEPLFYPHIIPTLKKTKELGFEYSMITNAQDLSGESAELMADSRWIRISADYFNAQGFNESRRRSLEDFEDIEKNICGFIKIKDKDCDVGVNLLVHHLNYEDIKDCVKFIRDLGVGNVRIAPVWKKDFEAYHADFKDVAIANIQETITELKSPEFDIGSTYERYFARTGKENRDYPKCYMMQVVPVIGADSNIYTCHNKAYDPAAIIGSIKDMKFSEAWFSKAAKHFFDRFDPAICTHECAADEKNKLIHEWFAAGDPGVVNFI